MAATRIRLSPASCVLDASALLALLRQEPGGDLVEPRLGQSLVSAVNWTEVAERREALDRPVEELSDAMNAAGLVIVPFAVRQAHEAAALRPSTRRVGLSLADRACLSLARLLDLPAVSADREWAKLEIGVRIELIR